ncbi:MAG: polymorphic toxin type 44 domain-containing protein [Candidatus Acidiferrales bacterium]
MSFFEDIGHLPQASGVPNIPDGGGPDFSDNLPPALQPKPFQLKNPCPPVPQHPASADVNANIAATRQMNFGTGIDSATHAMADAWWVNQVWQGHAWDYKAQGYQWHDFGNFNFGATGTALGLGPGVVLRGAGFAKHAFSKVSPSNLKGSLLLGIYPYNNTYDDAAEIQAGIDYVNAGCDHQ